MWAPGFTNVTGAGQEEGAGQEGESWWGGFGREAGEGGVVGSRRELRLSNLCSLCSLPIGSWRCVEPKPPALVRSPPHGAVFLLGPGDQCFGPRLSADLGPTGEAAVEGDGECHISGRLGKRKSGASPRQLGQPWQMFLWMLQSTRHARIRGPLEGRWKFITKHIGILGCSWFRFSGGGDSLLILESQIPVVPYLG